MKKSNELVSWSVIWKKKEGIPAKNQPFLDMWDITHIEHFAKHVVNPTEKWNEIFGCEIFCDRDLADAVVVFKEKKSLKTFAESCYKSKVSAHRCWQWLRSEIRKLDLESEEQLHFENIKNNLQGNPMQLVVDWGESCCGFSIKKVLITFDKIGGGLKTLRETFIGSVRPNDLLEKYRNAIRKSVAWTGEKPRHAQYYDKYKRETITGVDDRAIRFICTPDQNNQTALRMLTAFRADVGKSSFEKECEMLDLICAKKWGQKIRECNNAKLYTEQNWGV